VNKLKRQKRWHNNTKLLPNVTMIEIQRIDKNGELRGRLVSNKKQFSANYEIFVSPLAGNSASLSVGDRLIARLKKNENGSYEARAIKIIETVGGPLVGLIELIYDRNKDASFGRIKPTDRRFKKEFIVASNHLKSSKSGELVLAERLAGYHHNLPKAKVLKRLGPISSDKIISLVAIHSNNIPVKFPRVVIKQSKSLIQADIQNRKDLRSLPFVTIDGPDAHDFDDAVWAEPDTNPDNVGGWHAIVAIADVTYFMRAGDPLDIEARNRGNSVYFPDRVVPMLPEHLSNDLCSLKPGEDRACLAVHLYICPRGNIKHYNFERGLIRSIARLDYLQFQLAIERKPSDVLKPYFENVVMPLYNTYLALSDARIRRGALDLELPERRVTLDSNGHIKSITEAPRYDSHKLIEEFMIAANVAAAQILENKSVGCIYRIHDQPDSEKLEALTEIISALKLKVPRNHQFNNKQLNKILNKSADGPFKHITNTLILRAQSRAEYSTKNIGHFGLGLSNYTHFTSPIRRYSDVLIHRAIITTLQLGDGGFQPEDKNELDNICSHISTTERRASIAERTATDRYAANYLIKYEGSELCGRISGITRFGVFVQLDETGADGLIPFRTMQKSRRPYSQGDNSISLGSTTLKLGDHVVVKLQEVNIVTAQLILSLIKINDQYIEPAAASRVKRSSRKKYRKLRSRKKSKF